MDYLAEVSDAEINSAVKIPDQQPSQSSGSANDRVPIMRI